MRNSFLMTVLACLVAAPFVVGCKQQPAAQQAKPLVCLVGGTMRPAMEELVKLYAEQTGEQVQLDFGDSGALITRVENERGQADLYVCHDPFLDVLMSKGLGDRGWTVARLKPVIVVQPGNPRNVRGLADLTQPGLTLVVTDYTRSTLGNMLPTMFAKAGVDLEKLKETNIKKTVRGGNEAANSVVAGGFDAAICWDAVAFLRKDQVEVVPIPAEHLPQPSVDALTSATGKVYDIGVIKVTIATLKDSHQLDAARRFAEFVASPAGAAVFDRWGFSPTPGSATQAAK